MAKVSTEGDAVEIVNILTESGFDASKSEVGEGEAVRWGVTVDEGWFSGGEVAQATQVLNYYGLPRADEADAGAQESGGMFPSPSAESARQLKERERKIEKTLRILPGVARVEVNIVLPENNDIKIKPYKASASVVIRLKEEQARFDVEQVKDVVVTSVPDLQRENISATLTYVPPPAIQRQDLNLRRRNRIILYVGVALFVALGALLAALWSRTRRQQAELASLREAEEAAAGAEAKDEALPAATQLPGAEPPRLADGQAAADARARQLPAG